MIKGILLCDYKVTFDNVLFRMMGLRPGAEQNMMVEVHYRQGREGISVETVVQDVYLCASMEFLLTVADVFLKATQHGFAQVPQPKTSAGAGEKKHINSTVTVKEPSESALTSPYSSCYMPLFLMCCNQCHTLMSCYTCLLF